MFTGIVTAVATVRAAEPAPAGGMTLTVAVPWDDIAPGESVAVDGACLTVARAGAGWLAVDVVETTLARTAFRQYAVGRRVNLERALRVGDRLGGHMVQGHVDAVARILGRSESAGGRLLDIELPDAVARVTTSLGSITVDGVSLTVQALPRPGVVQVSLIPFTLQHTTLGERNPGDAVHLEGDMIGKYLREFTAPDPGSRSA
jgi:riboflavin synthase